MKSVTQEKVDVAFSSFILSASGWRKVFVASGDDFDAGEEVLPEDAYIVGHMTDVFCDFLEKKGINAVVIGQDSRPTGRVLASVAMRVFASRGIASCYIGVAATPEVLCYAKQIGAFFYLSASHNPIGHNGIKMGLGHGSVLDGADIKPLIESVKKRCSNPANIPYMTTLLNDFPDLLCEADETHKKASLAEYEGFVKIVAADTDNLEEAQLFHNELKALLTERAHKDEPIVLFADFNGSSRVATIDRHFFEELGLDFKTINEKIGSIVHGIVPEGENLQYCADLLTNVQKELPPGADLIGYMPDCDGDRGNIVFWDSEKKTARIPSAQEVFALSVVSELSFLTMIKNDTRPIAIVANDATSMCIEEIAAAFDAEVFRAEVGEANLVKLAALLREKGYVVRIFGEGSNGGSIIHPAAVRDPLNSILSILKLLTLKTKDGQNILTHYCERIGVAKPEKITLATVLALLPSYTTTAISEAKAQQKIAHINQGDLKKFYQQVFKSDWEQKKDMLAREYGIRRYEARANVGTRELKELKDFAQSESGGLRILFYTDDTEPFAFMWMRKSGTEAIVRLLADIKGNNQNAEAFFLAWHSDMLARAAEKAAQQK